MDWTKQEKPIIALAPMADYTDEPFCRVCREVFDETIAATFNLTLKSGGKQSFVIFREMVSAEAIVRASAKTLKMCEFKEFERPLVIQIFGAKPETMAQAAQIIIDKFNPDGIDINMGCPVPKIAGKNQAGAALMKDPDRAVAIVEAIKKVAGKTPISVKTRLGWAKEDEILALAPRLEAAGADLLTIHGRTKLQGYTGKANWEMIGKVRQMVKIPILANGDINEENFSQCLKITGADGLMIGRSALGNPWIFSRINNKQLTNNNPDEIVKTVLRHAELHLERYGEKSMVTFRKHLLWYFKGNRISSADLKSARSKMALVKNYNELEDILQSFFTS